MVKVKIDECVCCTNTELYGRGKIRGLHCGGKIGEKCPFCKDGIMVKKEYWIDKKYLEIKILNDANVLNIETEDEE